MARAPTGYRAPTAVRADLHALTGTDWRVPLLLAVGDHLVIAAAAASGYFAWAMLPLSLAVMITLGLYVVQARAMRGLENLVHDGSHYNWVRSRRRVNDFLTNLFCAWPVFTSVCGYRVSHLKHHNQFGSDDDPDQVRYRQLVIDALDRRSLATFVAGFTRRALWYTGGWWRAVGTNLRTVCGGVAWHAGLITAAVCLLPTGAVVFTWVVFVLIPFLFVLPAVRFVAEAGKHDYAQPTLFLATISNIGLIHRWLFHPHGDGYHLEHHLFPCVPQYRLHRVRALLVRHDPEAFAQSARVRTRVLQSPTQH